MSHGLDLRKKEREKTKERTIYMMDKQTAFDEQQYSNSKVGRITSKLIQDEIFEKEENQNI